MYLNPIEYLLFLVGGPKKVAEILSVDNSLITRWRKNKSIPEKYQNSLVNKLEDLGFDYRHKYAMHGKILSKKEISQIRSASK